MEQSQRQDFSKRRADVVEDLDELLPIKKTRIEDKLSLKLLQMVTELTTPCSVLLNATDVTRYLQSKSASNESADTTQEVTPVPRHTKTSQYQCSVCQNEYSSIQNLRNHEKKHKINFYCGVCNQIFTSENMFKIHISEVHNIMLSCKMSHSHTSKRSCKHKYPVAVMRKHVEKLSEKDKKFYECKLCNYAVTHAKYLLCHVKQEHYVKKCFNCGRCFLNTCNLVKHIDQCFTLNGKIKLAFKLDLLEFTFKINTCPLCLYASTPEDLDLHMYECNNKPDIDIICKTDIHKCPFCKTVIENEIMYYQHLVNCNASFGARNYYKIMQQLDKNTWSLNYGDKEIKKEIYQWENHFLNENDNSCTICNNISIYNINVNKNPKLNTRLLNTTPSGLCKTNDVKCQAKIEYPQHSNFNLKQWSLNKCKQCFKLFKCKESLARHMFYHCKSVNNEADDLLSGLFDIINSHYYCNQCGYETTDLQFMKLHAKAYHIQNMKLKCDFCKKYFKSKDEIENHLIENHVIENHLNKPMILTVDVNSVNLNIVKYENITENLNNEEQLGQFLCVDIQGVPNIEQNFESDPFNSDVHSPSLNLSTSDHLSHKMNMETDTIDQTNLLKGSVQSFSGKIGCKTYGEMISENTLNRIKNCVNEIPDHNSTILIKERIETIIKERREKMYIVCKCCKKDIPLGDYFPQHVILHTIQHNTTEFYCHICDEGVFNKIEHLYQHFWLQHVKPFNLYASKSDVIPCFQCDKYFFNEDARELHFLYAHSVYNSKFMCSKTSL